MDDGTVAPLQAVQGVGSNAAFGEISFEWRNAQEQQMVTKQQIRLPEAEADARSLAVADHMPLAFRALWDLCSILRRWRRRLNVKLSRQLAGLQSSRVSEDSRVQAGEHCQQKR